MMLGWGLRGTIGGGPFGAMIPGAMVVLAACLTKRIPNLALLAACGAIGVGIGGDMTYGQTVGFIVHAETFWWGFLGLSLKGAIWGALGGAVIALGFTPRWRLVLGGGTVMAVATELGWKFINEPKLIYFSNLADRPRAEIWAGFLLAAAGLVVYLAWQGRTQPALRFALAGFLGGGIGFGFGGAIQGIGVIFAPALKLHWWKYMEFFFGFVFGWALAWAFSKFEDPKEDAATESPRQPLWIELFATAALTAVWFWSERVVPLRFTYLVMGSAVLLLLTLAPWLSKHVAYSVTFTAVAFDLARYWSKEYKRGAMEPAYALAVVLAVVFAIFVNRWHNDALRLLELLMWSCVAAALVKWAMPPTGLANLIDHVALGFVLMAIAVRWMARAVRRDVDSA